MKILIIGICIILFFCFFSFTQGEKKIPYGNNPAAGKYYDIRGIKMYCEIYGSGRPLLMIHGNGGSIGSFENNIPFFSKHYRVIIADSRSQGKSKDAGDSLSFEMMADDEAALLNALQVYSADVLGWSDGGIVALLLAMRHPEKVKKLASTGANLWPDSSAIVSSVWENDKAIFDSFGSTEPESEEGKNNRKLFLLDWLQPNISLAELHEIKCPSLIIGGDHDVIKTEHTTMIFQNIPNAELWIVPNSGHETLIEHKDEFNKKVAEFFYEPLSRKKLKY